MPNVTFGVTTLHHQNDYISNSQRTRDVFSLAYLPLLSQTFTLFLQHDEERKRKACIALGFPQLYHISEIYPSLP